jgi:glycosyltransferase involved in cell wall biosynthesis
MNVNFISFLDPAAHHGGGEQITAALLEEGERRGYTFHKTFQNPKREDYNEKADLNILWDITNCPEQNNPFDQKFLNEVVDSGIPFIYGTGGYEDICSLGTLPCGGDTDGITCTAPRSHRTFGEGGIYRRHPKVCPAKERAFLLKKASLCIFFSELHREMTEKIIGEVNSFIAIPPVQGLEKYYNEHRERDIDLLSYGGHLEYKGFFNILEAFPDRECVFIGGGPSVLPQLYGYGQLAGKVPQEEMPGVLNRTKTFVHTPRWPEPYGITTIQAALCGCEVIENDNSVVLQQFAGPGHSKTLTTDASVEAVVKEIKKWEKCEPIWNRIEEVTA